MHPFDWQFNIEKHVSFFVYGRPVPWSPPRVFRYGQKKNPELVEWQAKVAEAAREAWGPWEATSSPISLGMIFGIETDDVALAGTLAVPTIKMNKVTEKHTKRGASRADLTNLGKGTEDGIEGIIVVNDLLVVHKQELSIWAFKPYVQIIVRVINGTTPIRGQDDRRRHTATEPTV